MDMSISSGYLTPKQCLLWGLKRGGIREADIARKLHVSRVTVHQAVARANLKVSKALEEAAHLNKIDVETVDAKKGFLSGYSAHFKTQAFIIFSAKNGVQIWYKHEGNCKSCKRLQACRDLLLAEAEERRFLVTEDPSQILPSRLADVLFSRIMEEHEKHGSS
jgi:hypothetical protein